MFAQLVQNGLLRECITRLIEEDYTIDEIKNKIRRIYEKINNFSYFVQEQDNDKQIKREVLRLISSKPEILLISSKGAASSSLKLIKTTLIDQHKGTYDYRVIEGEGKLLILLFLKFNA